MPMTVSAKIEDDAYLAQLPDDALIDEIVMRTEAMEMATSDVEQARLDNAVAALKARFTSLRGLNRSCV